MNPESYQYLAQRTQAAAVGMSREWRSQIDPLELLHIYNQVYSAPHQQPVMAGLGLSYFITYEERGYAMVRRTPDELSEIRSATRGGTLSQLEAHNVRLPEAEAKEVGLIMEQICEVFQSPAGLVEARYSYILGQLRFQHTRHLPIHRFLQSLMARWELSSAHKQNALRTHLDDQMRGKGNKIRGLYHRIDREGHFLPNINAPAIGTIAKDLIKLAPLVDIPEDVARQVFNFERQQGKK